MNVTHWRPLPPPPGGLDVSAWCAVEREPVKPSEADIARTYCRRLLPHLPASPESHMAIPLWALRALIGTE